MSEDSHEIAKAINDLHDALVGTTSRNLMCPSCGYVKGKSVRNTERPYVIVVWECPCGRLNHTKLATRRPKIDDIDISIKIGR